MESKNKVKIRFSSLDIMRGIAITLMIEAHILIRIPSLEYFSNYFAAPFFIIIAGVSYQLFLKSRAKKLINNNIIFLETFWRAIILFIITLCLYLFGTIIIPSFYPYQGLITWSIFQVIALGYLFGFLIRKNFKLQIMAIIIIYLLYYLITYYHLNSFYFLVKGTFPPITWLAYFFIGQLIFSIYKKKNLTFHSNLKMLNISLIIVIIFALLIPFSQFKFTLDGRSTLEALLISASILSLILVLLIRFIDLKGINSKILKPFENIGKISLTSYYIHIPLVFLLSYLFMNKLTPFASNLIILILSITILSIIERILRKYNYAPGLEWLLRLLTEKMMKYSLILYKSFNKKLRLKVIFDKI